jgi:hypothetical protein
MKRIVTFTVLLLACAAASAQTTQITASNISKFGGAKVTGQFCVTPTDSSGNPINLTTPAGQQFAPSTSLCFPIVNGVLSAYAIVPDTSLTQPANACYKLTVTDNRNNQIGTYPCIQPSGTSWSFDAYVPSTLPSTTALSLPQFQTDGVANGNQGILNIVGAGSCSVTNTSGTGTVTITCTGSGSSNENLSFSATPTFSTATTSSRIALSGNITTFTLAAGTDGQNKCLGFAHDATSNTYMVTAPGNVVGLMGVGSVASKHSVQCFTYFSTDALWVANSPGVINQ